MGVRKYYSGNFKTRQEAISSKKKQLAESKNRRIYLERSPLASNPEELRQEIADLEQREERMDIDKFAEGFRTKEEKDQLKKLRSGSSLIGGAYNRRRALGGTTRIGSNVRL